MKSIVLLVKAFSPFMSKLKQKDQRIILISWQYILVFYLRNQIKIL